MSATACSSTWVAAVSGDWHHAPALSAPGIDYQSANPPDIPRNPSFEGDVGRKHKQHRAKFLCRSSLPPISYESIETEIASAACSGAGQPEVEAGCRGGHHCRECCQHRHILWRRQGCAPGVPPEAGGPEGLPSCCSCPCPVLCSFQDWQVPRAVAC